MMKKLLLCLPFLVLPIQALGQGQPVVPVVAGAAVSSSNPMPVTPISGGTAQDVNLKQVAGASVQTGHGTAAGTVRVELPTDGTGVVGLNAGANIVGKVGIDQTTPGTTNGVQVNAALPAGTNTIGSVLSQGSASIASAQVSVGSTATVVVAGRAGRRAVTIINHSTTDIFCGGPSVTTSTGALLTGTKGSALTVPTAAAISCIVATGSATVSELETF